MPLAFIQDQCVYGAASVPQAPLPPQHWGCNLGQRAWRWRRMRERGGEDGDRPLPPLLPPKPQILRPGGVTTEFHSTDRKEIKSF